MSTDQSGRDRPVPHIPKRLIRAVVCLGLSVIALHLSRVGIKVVSSWIDISAYERNLLFLVPLLTLLTFSGFIVFRLRDRWVRSAYSVMAILLISTHVTAVLPIDPEVPQWVITIADGVALILLATVFFRVAILLIRSYQQRHEQLLDNLAFGTSHRVGHDFLAGLVESIAATLRVRFVFVSEVDHSGSVETILSCAGLDAECTRLNWSPGHVVNSEEIQSAVGNQGTSVYRRVLTDIHGDCIGRLVIFHEPTTISASHESSLQIFASRASAELQRMQADRQRQDLETRVQQGQKMESLGLLAGGIAHDFNNLLQAVRGYTTLAADSCEDDQPTHQLIRSVDGVVDKGAMLCDRLLAYAGRAVRQNSVCCVNDIVDEMVHIIQAARTDCAIALYPSDRPLSVWGDAGQLSQVVMNLLTNAVESLDGTQGTIEVRTRMVVAGEALPKSLQLTSDCDYAVIHVTDTGCGISEGARARIFDPFYTTKGQGHGIGLAAVAGIVKDHSGDIAFDSQLSVGTSFTVALPLTHVENDLPGLTSQKSSVVERLNVLLVDDDELVLTSVRMLLEAAGMQVTISDCGSDALAIVEECGSPFDAILLDQTMPGMSGLETCRMLRQRGVDSPVVLMSGFSEVNIDKSLDGVHFLGKPCSRTQLIEVLSDAAGSPSTARESAGRQAG